MKKVLRYVPSVTKTIIGCAIFAIGFNLFLQPGGLNAGGISGLAMILAHLLHLEHVGVITALMNIPLFLLAGTKIGKKFFCGSLLGMVCLSVFLEVIDFAPTLSFDPFLTTIYGGVICGAGLGLVFSSGYSTGGSDIIVRLLKKKWPNVPIGTINIVFDLTVALLTGIVYWDFARALYTGIATFISGQIIDAVVYRFDYSRVALIISKKSDEVALAIGKELNRGATFLHGEGVYSHSELKVILTAVKRQQLAELKELVVSIDPDAFIIVQEAHQVLGDGFSRYSKDSL